MDTSHGNVTNICVNLNTCCPGTPSSGHIGVTRIKLALIWLLCFYWGDVGLSSLSPMYIFSAQSILILHYVEEMEICYHLYQGNHWIHLLWGSEKGRWDLPF